MLNRRDLILGIVLLAVVAGFLFFAIVGLTIIAFDNIPISKECVGVIEITGPIISPGPVVEQLERFIKDDKIIAIVIRLNTPGGGVSATQEIYDTVLKARSAERKVVASMGANGRAPNAIGRSGRDAPNATGR